MNDTHIPVLSMTRKVTADIEAHRFIEADGSLPVAKGHALGVTQYEAKANELATVMVLGVTQVQVSAAVALGDALMVDADGRVKTNNGGKAVARALSAASAENDLIPVLLLPN